MEMINSNQGIIFTDNSGVIAPASCIGFPEAPPCGCVTVSRPPEMWPGGGGTQCCGSHWAPPPAR